MDPVPTLTVFELIPSASDICDWNTLLELLGTMGNPVSEVFSCLRGRSKLNSRKLLCQIHLYMASWHSSGDWQFKQSVAMALPTVILKAGWLRCWAARFLPGCVAR